MCIRIKQGNSEIILFGQKTQLVFFTCFNTFVINRNKKGQSLKLYKTLLLTKFYIKQSYWMISRYIARKQAQRDPSFISLRLVFQALNSQITKANYCLNCSQNCSMMSGIYSQKMEGKKKKNKSTDFKKFNLEA